ncbi:MAG: hypothetical protein CSB24_01470 [Deltaproteobacteria bacterium]|nr:MAG: hypothetical protein CSB24_01470 [Deltaproteobacteria bacterium]
MDTLTAAQIRRAVLILALLHIIIITISNYLVQIPVKILGFYTTWGTFSFPLVYLATDLTVRIFGRQKARKIIFLVMLPALFISYLISVIFFEGRFQGLGSLTAFNLFVFRIALASFAAYAAGQFADILVFSRLRALKQWWIAPAASSLIGNLLDTIVFYYLAFWKSPDAFMAAHWLEIGTTDYCFKLLVSLMLFLPAYGVILKAVTSRIIAEQRQPLKPEF